MPRNDQQISVRASLIIGGIMIALGLLVAIFVVQNPALAAWIIRVTVALGAGFMSAGILGAIEITNPIGEVAVKAGGPIAITVLLYVWNPAPAVVQTLLGGG